MHKSILAITRKDIDTYQNFNKLYSNILQHIILNVLNFNYIHIIIINNFILFKCH